MSEVNKLTIKTPERRQWRCSVVFILNFEHIPHLSVAFRLLLWTSWCLLVILRNTKQKKLNKSIWKLAKWNKKWNKKSLKKRCTFSFLLSMFFSTFMNRWSPGVTPFQAERSTDVEMVVNTTLKTIRYFMSCISKTYNNLWLTMYEFVHYQHSSCYQISQHFLL